MRRSRRSLPSSVLTSPRSGPASNRSICLGKKGVSICAGNPFVPTEAPFAITENELERPSLGILYDSVSFDRVGNSAEQTSLSGRVSVTGLRYASKHLHLTFKDCITFDEVYDILVTALLEVAAPLRPALHEEEGKVPPY